MSRYARARSGLRCLECNAHPNEPHHDECPQAAREREEEGYAERSPDSLWDDDAATERRRRNR
jgi:hypothetical protein